MADANTNTNANANANAQQPVGKQEPSKIQSLKNYFNDYKSKNLPIFKNYINTEPLVIFYGIIFLAFFSLYLGYKHGINSCIQVAKRNGVPVCPNNPAKPAT